MRDASPFEAPTPRTDSSGPLLFVTYAGVWGGAERVLLDTIHGLDEPAVLLCPSGPLATRARAAGIPVVARPARSLELRGGARVRAGAALGLVAHALEVRTVALSLRARAVVAWGMRSGIACASALGTVRGRPPLVFEHADFLPSRGVGRAVRAAARVADRVITVSAAVSRDLDPEGRLTGRMQVAPPGVDLDRFVPSPWPPGPPTVLVLGAIVPWKRPDLALEAVALAARELPELELVVAGHALGPASERLLESLRRRAAEPDLSDRVRFPGALADPGEAIARSSCVLHCADREPFGLVLLEAMASGRPVVAPAAGGPLEIVTDACGRLFPPGDADAAARALVELLGDRDRARVAGERARMRAAERFGLDAARRRWRDAVGPLLGRGDASERAGAGLTLVTVAHDSERELERLLASVARYLPGAAVVVVDSGSEDGSATAARSSPGRVNVIELDNVGYGRAANAGVAVVETPACVVLNADVELVDGSLAALAAEALGPGAPERLLAPLVLRPDGTRQDSVHGEPVSGVAALTALIPPAALPPPLRQLVQPWRGARPRAVTWAVGCCLGGRAETLRRLGPFDAGIFLYGEDLELGLRARDVGIPTWWWPHARVIHHEAHATRRAFGGEPFELLARQRHAVVAERRGDRAARWDDRLQLATFANRIALKRLAGRGVARERAQLAALRQVMHQSRSPGATA
jgi:glycosyltransferase involved in cell wall biosynthesis/GT2 family glycosyltransferase